MNIRNKSLRRVLWFLGVIKIKTLEKEMLDIEKEILNRFESLEKFNNFMKIMITNILMI